MMQGNSGGHSMSIKYMLCSIKAAWNAFSEHMKDTFIRYPSIPRPIYYPHKLLVEEDRSMNEEEAVKFYGERREEYKASNQQYEDKARNKKRCNDAKLLAEKLLYRDNILPLNVYHSFAGRQFPEPNDYMPPIKESAIRDKGYDTMVFFLAEKIKPLWFEGIESKNIEMEIQQGAFNVSYVGEKV